MKKAKCIKCGEEINFLQLMKHSWKKPVVCSSCGTKMHFDKKEWKKATTPSLIAMIPILLITFIGPTQQKEYAILFLILSMLMLFMAIFWFGIKTRGIKLVLAENKKT